MIRSNHKLGVRRGSGSILSHLQDQVVCSEIRLNDAPRDRLGSDVETYGSLEGRPCVDQPDHRPSAKRSRTILTTYRRLGPTVT